MISAYGGPLLAADDPHTFTVYNRKGSSPYLFVGDHAGNAIPRRLGTLGIGAEDRERHIAWDIGTASLGRALSERLDATFVQQNYSRLVIDCNRAPRSAEAILAASDGTLIPGNKALDPAAIQQRIVEIHSPYHAEIDAILSVRSSERRETILISLHSFTPSLGGISRPWPIGLLYQNGNVDFALGLLATLRASIWSPVGDNEPYRMDETDYTVPLHSGRRNLSYAEIEFRQDELSTSEGVDRAAEHFAAALAPAAVEPKS